MKLRLNVLTPGKWEGKTIPIARFPFLIGRDAACQLRPASPLVSNRHCVLLLRGGQVLVHDLGSTNGTFLNDKKIDGEEPLAHGDWLRIGPLDFDVAIEAGTPVNQPTPVPPNKESVRKADDRALNTLLSALRDEAPAPSAALAVNDEPVPEGRTAMDIHLRELVEWEEIGDTVALHFTDPKILDEKKIQEIGEQLQSLIEGSTRRKLILNLGNVRAMSSALVDQIIAFSKKVRSINGQLIVCNIHPSVYPVFQTMKLTKVLAIHKDEQEALQAFR